MVDSAESACDRVCIGSPLIDAFNCSWMLIIAQEIDLPTD